MDAKIASETPSSACLYDAVMPTLARDLPFLELHLRTLHRLEDLGTYWIVAPNTDVNVIRDAVSDRRIVVVAEEEAVPALRHFPDIRGWHKQQLIKLAVASQSSAEACITFDSDVLCVRPLRYGDVVQNGRVTSRRSPREADEFLAWYDDSARVLGCARSSFIHAVTPCALSPAAARELAKYIAETCSPVPRGADAPSWLESLLARLPWTEYALYFTFLEMKGLRERYHFDAESSLYGNCVWNVKEAGSWDPAKSFEAGVPFFFSVLQSCIVDPEVLRELVLPYLDGSR